MNTKLDQIELLIEMIEDISNDFTSLEYDVDPDLLPESIESKIVIIGDQVSNLLSDLKDHRDKIEVDYLNSENEEEVEGSMD